ncbi:hypothetical protein [Flavobacterium sp.]|uniref:hypothetical protein n=1 Tax=Flavobacterium sp. TaxID=239 RepID=UPI0026086D00|nr:hypothetical protein [Flavobacterium sp.]
MKMKNLHLLLILLSFTNSFSQNDSIKKYTNLEDFGGNKYKLEGNWKEVYDGKYENFITHCPILRDNKNNILEFAKWDSSKLSLQNGNNLTEINLSLINYLNEKKIEILGLESGPKKNYFIYKLNLNSKIKQNEKVILYNLIGVKGKYVYSIVYYSYENKLENSSIFLADTFNNN